MGVLEFEIVVVVRGYPVQRFYHVFQVEILEPEGDESDSFMFAGFPTQGPCLLLRHQTEECLQETLGDGD